MDEPTTAPQGRVWAPSSRPPVPEEEPVWIVGDVPPELSRLVEPRSHADDLHRYAYGQPRPTLPVPAASQTSRHNPLKHFLKGFVTASVVMMAMFGLLVASTGSFRWPQTVTEVPKVSVPSPSAPVAQQLVALTRDLCKETLASDAKVCTDLRVTIDELPEGVAAQVLFSIDRENATVMPMRMTLSPQVLVADENVKTYYIVHEWSHVKIGQIAGTPDRMDKIQQRAADVLGARIGKTLTPDRGAELLTDCLAAGSGLVSSSVTSSYFYEYGVTDGARFCSGWQDLLLG